MPGITAEEELSPLSPGHHFADLAAPWSLTPHAALYKYRGIEAYSASQAMNAHGYPREVRKARQMTCFSDSSSVGADEFSQQLNQLRYFYNENSHFCVIYQNFFPTLRC